VCGKLLIRSILVLLFSFEVPLKKCIKKDTTKNRKNRIKRQKKRDSIEGALCVCVLFCFVRLCFVITFVSRFASLAQSSLGPTYYHR
jgi:hypothetical protein